MAGGPRIQPYLQYHWTLQRSLGLECQGSALALQSSPLPPSRRRKGPESVAGPATAAPGPLLLSVQKMFTCAQQPDITQRVRNTHKQGTPEGDPHWAACTLAPRPCCTASTPEVFGAEFRPASEALASWLLLDKRNTQPWASAKLWINSRTPLRGQRVTSTNLRASEQAEKILHSLCRRDGSQ